MESLLRNTKQNRCTHTAVQGAPPPDIIGVPVLALKNFRITRRFHTKYFFVAVMLGMILPLTLIVQTTVFLCYSEDRFCIFVYATLYCTLFSICIFNVHIDDDIVYRDFCLCSGMENIDYKDRQIRILIDFLGLIVGRQPGQDPETAKDREWFLRQTMSQKIWRAFLTLLVCLVFWIMIDGFTELENTRVSRQETVIPFLIYTMLWVLLSGFISYKPEIFPPLPDNLVSQFKSTTLYFGQHFDHQSSAYKFLRAYRKARMLLHFVYLFSIPPRFWMFDLILSHSVFRSKRSIPIDRRMDSCHFILCTFRIGPWYNTSYRRSAWR